MKKYIIFAVGFLVLFSLFQVLSGMLGFLYTAVYTPNVEEAWIRSGSSSQEVIMRGSHSSFLPTLIIAILSALIAYFVPKKLRNAASKRKET